MIKKMQEEFLEDSGNKRLRMIQNAKEIEEKKKPKTKTKSMTKQHW